MYKMNENEMRFIARALRGLCVEIEETRKNMTYVIADIVQEKEKDSRTKQIFDDIVSQLRRFSRDAEKIGELQTALDFCVSKTTEAESNACNIIRIINEHIESVHPYRSGYERYKDARKEYSEFYSKWSEKNDTFGNRLLSGILNMDFIESTKNALSGKSDMVEMEKKYMKSTLSSVLQDHCKKEELKLINKSYEKDMLDMAKDAGKVYHYSADAVSAYLGLDTMPEKIKKQFLDLTGVKLDKTGKIIKYGTMGAEYLEYIINDYNENLEYLRTFKTAFSKTGSSRIMDSVINELEEEYSNKFITLLKKAADDATDMAGGAAVDAVMMLTPGTAALKLVSDGMDLALDITKVNDNMDNWAEIVYYNDNIVPDLDNAIDVFQQQYENGTLSTEDATAYQQLMEFDIIGKKIMYEKMAVGNAADAADYHAAAETVSGLNIVLD
ncbi:MAG: hypothetical protein ACI4KD_08260 [Oscillospiraceae bacterium]